MQEKYDFGSGSVKNIAQVTRAMQAVSASKMRKSMQAMMNTRPYATKAWQVLTHIADAARS